MPTITAEEIRDLDRVLRIPMSLDEWWELDEDIRAEWVDGVAIVSPHASGQHQWIAQQLVQAVLGPLDEIRAVVEVEVDVSPTKYRRPDFAVFDRGADLSNRQSTALVVGEVISPSSRTEDRFRKAPDYLEAGIGQYWLVDPVERSVTVLINAGESWDVALELDDGHPTGSVDVVGHGTVELDVVAILDA